MTISKDISVTQAKAEFLGLVHRVETEGAEFVLRRRNKRVARIVPINNEQSEAYRSSEWANEIQKLHAEALLT